MPPRKKRESELQRPRSRKGGDSKSPTKGTANGAVWYDPPETWSEEVKNIWAAAEASGGSDFYEQSDVAFLYVILDDLNKARAGRLSGQLLQVLYGQLNNFLLTETDRRKANIELEKMVVSEEVPPEVAQMDEYRNALGL